MSNYNQFKDPAGTTAGMMQTSPPAENLKASLYAIIDTVDDHRMGWLLDLLRETDLEIHQQPATGLLMMTVKDSFNTPFHLGEILVTTAEVMWQGNKAHAMVMGDRPTAALVLAALELVPAMGDSELKNRLQAMVQTFSMEAAEERLRQAKMTAATRVNFESMKKENVDFGTLG